MMIHGAKTNLHFSLLAFYFAFPRSLNFHSKFNHHATKEERHLPKAFIAGNLASENAEFVLSNTVLLKNIR